MPVRISARSLDPLRNAATVTSCKYPALPASFCYRRCRLPSARICEKPAPGIRSANGGHGGASRPRSRRSHGSLSESAVEPEPASESVDDFASPSSNAAAALSAARVLSAASRNGRTTRPARCSPSIVGDTCMLSVAHAGAIEADRLLNRITQSRQEGDARLADRSNVGVGNGCWAFE
jgi:hypothetical protein